MEWQWVAVLAIVVLAWTVHKVTSMWQALSFYRYASDDMKKSMWEKSQGSND